MAALSGGQRQRVLIAQALANSPEYVFMDAPLAQIDPAAANEIVGLVAHLRNAYGIGMLFSTPDVNPIIATADQVRYLADGTGRIGPVDDVVTDRVRSGLYAVPGHVTRKRGQVFVMRDHCVHDTNAKPVSLDAARRAAS